MGIYRSGLRRLTGVAAATIIGGAIAVVVPLQASAAPPEVVFEDRFDQTYVDDELCEEGPVTIHEHVKVRMTAFFDKDGDFVRETLHLNVNRIVSGDGGELFDRWAFAGTRDPATETYRERGNQLNVHAGAGGVLANDSGLIEFTFDEEGEFVLLRVAGQRDSYPDGPGDPCGILFP